MALRRAKKDKKGMSDGAANFAEAGTAAGTDDVDPDDATTDDVTGSATRSGAADRRPLDEDEAGDDEVLPRLDLGGLRVPVLPDTELRVELNELQQPIAATVLHAGSTVQILAFAAPRNGGIWDEVRAEIAESVRADGGQVDEVETTFGLELRAKVRAEPQPGQVTEQLLRFVGFDGPRWFVRGVFSGPAATNPEQATVLESVLTSVVVVRGTDPMAPRDPLPLRLPREANAGPEAAATEETPARPTFELPVRGPEITETQ
jgi:hypothetical protein